MTRQAIAQQVTERLLSRRFKAFDDEFTINKRGTVYDKDGTPIWEFTEDDDRDDQWWTRLTAQELGQEIEKIFWYDRDMMISDEEQHNEKALNHIINN